MQPSYRTAHNIPEQNTMLLLGEKETIKRRLAGIFGIGPKQLREQKLNNYLEELGKNTPERAFAENYWGMIRSYC